MYKKVLDEVELCLSNFPPTQLTAIFFNLFNLLSEPVTVTVTETAPTVINDLLLTMDSDSTSVLLLLDLSGAFDTIAHSLLLDHWLSDHMFKSYCVISQSLTAKNLGVTFDPTLSFDQHIKEITKITFFHLRNIAKMRSFLSLADAEILILPLSLYCVHVVLVSLSLSLSVCLMFSPLCVNGVLELCLLCVV